MHEVRIHVYIQDLKENIFTINHSALSNEGNLRTLSNVPTLLPGPDSYGTLASLVKPPRLTPSVDRAAATQQLTSTIFRALHHRHKSYQIKYV